MKTINYDNILQYHIPTMGIADHNQQTTTHQIDVVTVYAASSSVVSQRYKDQAYELGRVSTLMSILAFHTQAT